MQGGIFTFTLLCIPHLRTDQFSCAYTQTVLTFIVADMGEKRSSCMSLSRYSAMHYTLFLSRKHCSILPLPMLHSPYMTEGVYTHVRGLQNKISRIQDWVNTYCTERRAVQNDKFNVQLHFSTNVFSLSFIQYAELKNYKVQSMLNPISI